MQASSSLESKKRSFSSMTEDSSNEKLLLLQKEEAPLDNNDNDHHRDNNTTGVVDEEVQKKVSADDIETETETDVDDPSLQYEEMRDKKTGMIDWRDYLESQYMQNEENKNKLTDRSGKDIKDLSYANFDVSLSEKDFKKVKQHGRMAFINPKEWSKFTNGAKPIIAKEVFDELNLNNNNIPPNAIVMATTLFVRLTLGDEKLHDQLKENIEKKHFPAESATHGAIKGTKDGKKEELFSGPSPDTIWGSTNGCYKYFPEFFKRTEGCFGIFAIGVKLAMMAMMGNQHAIKCIVGERHY